MTQVHETALADHAVSSGAVKGRSLLVCRVGSRLCALELDHVVETMRPLPVEALADAPAFIRGVSVVRGEPIPVVDACLLLGTEQTTSTRLVSINVDNRRIALAVDAVLGVQELDDDDLRALPPLLDGASGDAIAALCALDSELLVVLASARLVPDSVWVMFDEASLT